MDDSGLFTELLAVADRPISTSRLLNNSCAILRKLPWLEAGPQCALLLKHPTHFIPAVAEGFALDSSLGACRNQLSQCACQKVIKSEQAAILRCNAGLLCSPEPLLFMPLIAEQKPVGVLALATHHSGIFTVQQTATLKLAATLIANALSRLITEEIVELRELELEEARLEVVQKLGVASEYKDKETARHIVRMSEYAAIIAKGLGLSFEEQERIRLTAPMHDVGKIGIPDRILLKPGPLTAEEFEQMKTHTLIGSKILSGDSKLMQDARAIAIGHHEKWDGSGYPNGLQGEQIPLYSRICAVSDVFDALTSKRPYKDAWPTRDARQWIEEQSGHHFDPQVVAAFQTTFPEIQRIKALFSDEVINPNEKLNLPALPTQQHEFFHWDDSLSVGIDAIDAHHRYLIDLTNSVCRAVTDGHGSKKIGRALKALVSYTHVHFQAEENLMRQHHHPRFEIHCQEHAYFCQVLNQQLEEFRQNPLLLGHETLTFLKEWLINHVTGEDRHLRNLADT